MKILALYRPETEHERKVIDFQHDFEHVTGQKIELVSLDTVEGDNMARLYDVVGYPALLAVTDDGILKQLWQGEMLPLMNEVQAYILH